jgi:hypothetical protein
VKYIYIIILIVGFSLFGFLAGNEFAQFKPNPQESAQANEEQEFSTYVIGGFTLLALMIQCLIFARQEDTMAKQAKIMDRQTIIQTETSRPHVFIVGISVVQERGGWLTLGTIWKNSGLTPAIGLNTSMSLEHIFGGFIPDDFEYVLRTPFTEDVPLGVNREVIVDRVMVREDDLILNQGVERSWFIWGKAHYTDRFSPGVIHRVEYCFRLWVQNGNPVFMESGPHNRTYDEKTSDHGT